MAIPIAPTPILEGKEASGFLTRLMTEENDKKPLLPTPNGGRNSVEAEGWILEPFAVPSLADDFD